MLRRPQLLDNLVYLGVHFSRRPTLKLRDSYLHRSNLCAGPGFYVFSPSNSKATLHRIQRDIFPGSFVYNVHLHPTVPVVPMKGSGLEEKCANYSQYGAVIRFSRMPYSLLNLTMEEFYVPPTFVSALRVYRSI